MKYTKEQRRDFELWANANFFGGLTDISEEWDEERNCYKDFAFHMAFNAWMAANAQYRFVGQTDFRGSIYLKDEP